jgi:hypothetical protein
MKKLLAIGLALSLFVFFALPAFACDCDTAMAILQGVPDRLHRPWAGDPQGSDAKTKNYQNGPKQEVQPSSMNQDPKPQGEVKR